MSSDVHGTPSSSRIAQLVALAFFIQLLDSTIIATSLPHMALDFGVDAVAMSIGITTFLLAMALVIPASGWLAERWGSKRVLIFSVSLFTLASLVCGVSGGLESFIPARMAQGAAAGLMAPVGRLLVLRHAPKSELMRAIATITWPALFAPVIGPVLGGWITETVGWQWNFYINLPLGLLSALLFWKIVPQDRPGEGRRFDGRGFVLCGLSMVLVLGGLEALVGGFTALPVLLMLPAGLGLAVLTVLHLRRAPVPLLDLSVCGVTSFRMATITAGMFGRITINATPFLLPLLCQVGFGLTAVEAGQLLLVYFLGNLVMKSVTTPLLRHFGFRQVLVVNGLGSALCVGALGFVDPTASVLSLYPMLFTAGATRSLHFTALNTFAFADIPPEARTTSTTLAAMAQQFAMLLGVALPVLLIRLVTLTGGAGREAAFPFQIAFAGMSLLGVLSALAFTGLAQDAGREVTARHDVRADKGKTPGRA
ncbi:MFS transporter [Celeribacter indicus]|uniref:Drug resistance transporter, EmrB/QacA subfamily protein n=1 Tax=Celeribacter indicus TaxID=1208324 RepID=A0A0B5E317_9RHOB|nr:MFS transporter [Celeribacter indicus]AJE46837.1 drug resistance transporter, EmrB/QacA subfamily protein [Celeribacter indicus]SDW80670.1 drug resistance transporter, EmrB/QacA subfamily [Celeribacter indicus]